MLNLLKPDVLWGMTVTLGCSRCQALKWSSAIVLEGRVTFDHPCSDRIAGLLGCDLPFLHEARQLAVLGPRSVDFVLEEVAGFEGLRPQIPYQIADLRFGLDREMKDAPEVAGTRIDGGIVDQAGDVFWILAEGSFTIEATRNRAPFVIRAALEPGEIDQCAGGVYILLCLWDPPSWAASHEASLWAGKTMCWYFLNSSPVASSVNLTSRRFR